MNSEPQDLNDVSASNLPRPIEELTKHDLIHLIEYVGRSSHNAYSDERYPYCQSVALRTVETALERLSPELNYERGHFYLDRGVVDSLYHQRPMTLVQMIKFRDPSYIRFIQRHFGLPMTGKVEDMFHHYRKQRLTIDKQPIDQTPNNIIGADLLNQVIYDPLRFLDMAEVLAPGTSVKNFTEMKQKILSTDELAEMFQRKFIDALIGILGLDMMDDFLIMIVTSGDLSLLKYVIDTHHSPNGQYQIHIIVYLKMLIKTFRYANPTYTRRCYRLLSSCGFKLSDLSAQDIINLVESAAKTGNVPMTEYVMKWVRQETSFPNLRAILWTGLMFGAMGRNDFVNMMRYHKLLCRHHPDMIHEIKVDQIKHTGVFWRCGNNVVKFYFHIILVPDSPLSPEIATT